MGVKGHRKKTLQRKAASAMAAEHSQVKREKAENTPFHAGGKMRKKDRNAEKSARKQKFYKEVKDRLVNEYLRRLEAGSSNHGLYVAVLTDYKAQHDCSSWTVKEINGSLKAALKCEVLKRMQMLKLHGGSAETTLDHGDGAAGGAGGGGGSKAVPVHLMPHFTSTRGAGAGIVKAPIVNVGDDHVQTLQTIVSHNLFTPSEEGELCINLRSCMAEGVRVFESELRTTIRRMVEAKYGSLDAPECTRWGTNKPGFPSTEWFAGFCGRNDFSREKAEGRSTVRIQCATKQAYKTFGERLKEYVPSFMIECRAAAAARRTVTPYTRALLQYAVCADQHGVVVLCAPRVQEDDGAQHYQRSSDA